MSGSANVQRVDVITDFGNQMMSFQEEATAGVTSIEQQVNRALEWVLHDAPSEAQQRIRKCEQKVSEAQAALDSARIKNAGMDHGEGSSMYDEKKALDLAKKRLDHAREKYETIKKWGNKARREIDEFRGRIAALKRHLEGDLPRALALLDRTRASLDRYLERQVGAGGASTAPAAGAFLDKEQAETAETTEDPRD